MGLFILKKEGYVFKWREDYSVQIPLVDEQHKKLFEIADNLKELLDKDETVADEIIQSIGKLMKYTKYHFSQEEKRFSWT